MNALTIAASGMSHAMERFTRASGEFIGAVSGDGAGDPAAARVEALEAKLQFEASALVVHAWDDMMGALIDVQA